MKKTLVIGASPNPERYSYLAIESLRKHDHEVIAFGNRAGQVSGVPIRTELPSLADVSPLDTVTLYLNPDRQKEFYQQILALKPKRIIFNPGTENAEFENLAESKGVAVEEACTLVLLNTGQY